MQMTEALIGRPGAKPPEAETHLAFERSM